MRIRSNLREIIKTYYDKSQNREELFCRNTNKAITGFYLEEYEILFGKDNYYIEYKKRLGE